MGSVSGIPCRHETEPVVLTTGEIVGHVCIHCLASLAAEWAPDCNDCEWVLLSTFESWREEPVLARACDAHSRRWVA